jgi:hypothetical protein
VFVFPFGKYVFSIEATDGCQNVARASFNIYVLDDCTEHCTYTQGFYGNNTKGNGKFYWASEPLATPTLYTKQGLVDALIGRAHVDEELTGQHLQTPRAASCIAARLPAGVRPSAPGGYWFAT